MRLLKPITFLLMALVLTACPYIGPGYEYPFGELPAYPVNLEAFNSEYDDYNMSAPSLGMLFPFCFSTNRHSQGGEFNIRYEPMNIRWDKRTGEFSVTNEYGSRSSLGDDYGPLLNGVKQVNSAGNELGPYLLFDRMGPDFSDSDMVLLYATDEGGDFDIFFTYNNGSPDFPEEAPVPFLNSEFNDLYPSLNEGYSRMFFCSDREDGVFNIFSTEVDFGNNEMIGLLSDTLDHVVEKEEVLSGDYDDKCPYIFGNTLVFTSNRPGGSGGYDLYYSKFEEGAWGVPVNFGPEINSPADEYRVILLDPYVDIERDMMIFSSNRTGGLGGFDLYFVGILKER